jgi:hypothetical protein
MLRTTPIKYLISWVSIATVVCKNKRLKYVMLTNTDDNDVCKVLTIPVKKP